MPVPSKKQGENEEEFISRCMGDEVMKDEYGDIAQRYAVCIGSFEGKEDMTLFKYQYQKKNDINKLRNIGREIAIKSNMFQFKSYSDYGDEIKNNAKRGIELNEKNGNKCATQTGKVRAQQLAQGEPISEETIKRMYSYLSRAETYYDSADSNSDCGYISFLLWGGKSALSWSRNKLKEIEKEKFEVGVPHYTKDGKLYTGPTHKDADGRLMTGEVHTEDSEYLYHKDELAEIGPRGGIKPSDKAPKSDTPNTDPKRGSDKNKPGAASTGRGVEVPADVERSLQKKADEWNEKFKEKRGYGANIGALKTVYQRGVGAFQTSHSPVVKSSEQWGQARVNAFLYLLKNGRPENPKYTTDYDLLPKGHPKSDK